MKISIIVPVYNVEKEIKRCLNSLIMQTYSDFEVILVDDGSEDNSGRICDEYEKRDNRIIAIHKSNEGLSSARNKGLEMVTGDYVVFVDADDYLEPDFCENVSDVAGRTNAEIIRINLVIENRNKCTVKSFKSIDEDSLVSGKDFLLRTIHSKEFTAEAYSAAYSLKFWNEKSFRFVPGIYHEDMEIVLRVYLEAKTVAYAPTCYYHVVKRENSITNDIKKAEKRYRDMQFVIKLWIDLANGDNSNNEIRRLLYGLSAKIFIYTAMYNKPKEVDYSVISRGFLFRYALNIEEFAKAFLLVVSPKTLYFLWDRRHKSC